MPLPLPIRTGRMAALVLSASRQSPPMTRRHSCASPTGRLSAVGMQLRTRSGGWEAGTSAVLFRRSPPLIHVLQPHRRQLSESAWPTLPYTICTPKCSSREKSTGLTSLYHLEATSAGDDCLSFDGHLLVLGGSHLSFRSIAVAPPVPWTAWAEWIVT